MAATFVKKWAPGNISVVTVGTDNVTNPNTERVRIAEIIRDVNKFSAAHATDRGQIDAKTLGILISNNFDYDGSRIIKKDAGGGWIECHIIGIISGTLNQNNAREYNTKVRINVPAYNALAAAGKADIDAVTIAAALAAPFS